MNCPVCDTPAEVGQPLCALCGHRFGADPTPTPFGQVPAGYAGSPSGAFGQVPAGYAGSPSGAFGQVPAGYPGSPLMGASAPAGFLIDVAVCAVLLGVGLLVVAGIVRGRVGGGLADVVGQLTWLHYGLAAAIVLAYWFGSASALRHSAGRHIVASFAGYRPAGSLMRGLWPAVLTTAVAAAIGGVAIDGHPVAADPAPPSTASTPLATTPALASDLARQQAIAVNDLLDSSGYSKSDLGNALGSVCRSPSAAASTIRNVAHGRESQLARAQQLDTDALPNGDRIRGALIEALSHSLAADRAFVAYADHVGQYGCGADANYRNGMRSSEDAQAAKKTFLALWNPVAVQYGLPVRDSQGI